MANGRDRGRFGDGLIPFYGSTHPRLFEIERRCMDRGGVVIDFLDRTLPPGRVLDVGAGDGSTAARLVKPDRAVVALEPDPGMVDRGKRLLWASGIAQDIPFHDSTFDGAYATWAFFVAGVESAVLEEGLREVRRVVAPNGPIVVIDNAGDDEFCALSDRRIASDGSWWRARGFDRRVLVTAFEFDSVEEARELFSFYFGNDVRDRIGREEIEYKVAAYVGRSDGGTH